MKRRFLTFWVCFVVVHFAQAQTDSAQFLGTVTVVDQRLDYLKNVQFQYHIDSIQRLISPALNLGEWLQNSSNTNVRQYSPGSATSFSTRGASSAQSAIIWEGVPINSAATGVTDLSVVPMQIFTSTLNVGGSSALFGSGAIGSSLSLTGNNKPKTGLHVNFLQEVASFSTFKTGIGISFANKKWSSKSDFFYDKSTNNFPFSNSTKIPETQENRKHAGYYQWHAKQEVGYKINANQNLSASVWYTKALRETANSILINKPSVALLKDNYLRSKVGWDWQKKRQAISVSYAFLYEWQTYEDSTLTDGFGVPTLDTNITNTQLVQVNYSNLLNENWKWQNQLKLQYDAVSGSSRTGEQNVASVQSGMLYFGKKLDAKVAIRAEVFNGELLPISPWASVKYEWLKHFYTSVYGGYNYRRPSLNDRFWSPGGNPDLKPESGWTGEAAVFYNIQKANNSVLVRAAVYRSNLQNYIQWVPGQGGIWSPNNIKEVQLQGVDFNAEYKYVQSDFYGNVQAGFSYNESEVVKSELKGDQSIGEQIIYQPKYKSTASILLGYKKIYLKVQGAFVSSIATSYDGSTPSLANYQLFSIQLAKSFQLKKVDFTLIGAINNITDQVYQTIAYYPMPGRNFSITLKLNI